MRRFRRWLGGWGVLWLLLSACTSATVPSTPTATPRPPTAIPTPQATTTRPPASPTATIDPAKKPLTASDPTQFTLASGQIQLVEFFAFW